MTTEDREHEAEWRLHQARSEAILRASLDAIISMDHEGRIGEFNPAAEAMFSYARADAVGRPLADLIIPERLRDQHRRGLARYLATGVGVVVNRRVEMPALRADGSEFPAELAILPVSGADPPFFIGFLRDITDRKQAEQRQQFLVAELGHRSRNLLAVMQSLVLLGLSEDRPLSEARDALVGRIAALARSQTMLAKAGVRGAPLAEIIGFEFEAFSDRVKAVGPEVMLNPKAAQTFALLIHELATNAVKHGALSVPAGWVGIEWRVDGAGAEARFKFHWQEHNGPAVASPTRKGFGRTLLEQVASQTLTVEPTINFAPGGLTYEIDAPLDAVASSIDREAFAS